MSSERSASARYSLNKVQSRAFQLLCTKASSQCPDMQAGACMSFEGGQLAVGQSSGSFCVNALQVGLATMTQMDVLLELHEAPAPSQRLVCTGCRNHYRAAELELVYMPYGLDGEPDDDASMMKTIAALKGFEVMAPLPSATIERIAHMFTPTPLREGHVLIEQGQEGERLYLVEEGTLEVSVRQGAGPPTVVATLGAGTCVGEMSLLTGQGASATVTTTSPSKVLVLEKRAFHALLVQNPGLNIHFAQLLVERIRHNQQRLAQQVKSGMSGELATMSPQMLLQALSSANVSGRVELRSAGRGVELRFVDGELHQVNGLGGVHEDSEEMIYELLAWSDGSFSFEATSEVVQRTFFKNLLALMLEGTRRFDEARLRDLREGE
ncbi:MAG: cyclic nucleotide-binding domain-containing protein [Planctomycetota bacterium]